jgi:hypothetical protein
VSRVRVLAFVGVGTLVVGGAVLAARGGAVDDGLAVEPVPNEPAVQEYRDSITRRLDRLAREPRPVDRSALPPRHMDVDVFPTALVPRDRIVSGGPPPDGIPSIDDPEFEPVPEIDWIGDREPVLVLDLDGHTRVYPLQVMMWHEIVNDEIAGRPVTVTYCPLCNTGIAYDRTVGGRVLDFGVSGSLYQSAMVMYDRQTESLWTHVDGRSVIGELVGTQLELLPVAMVRWSDLRSAHPDALVLSRTQALFGRYGQNPYGAYGSGDTPLTGFFIGDVDQRLAPMERVVGIRDGDIDIAVTIGDLAESGTLSLDGDERPITVWHLPDAPWAIGAPTVGDADDTGITAVFDARHDGRELRFTRVGEQFVDDATGSKWDIFGNAVSGPLSGTQLNPLVHLDTFWFAWSTYRPGTNLADATG